MGYWAMVIPVALLLSFVAFALYVKREAARLREQDDPLRGFGVEPPAGEERKGKRR